MTLLRAIASVTFALENIEFPEINEFMSDDDIYFIGKNFSLSLPIFDPWEPSQRGLALGVKPPDS